MIILWVFNIRVDYNLNDFKINLYVYKCYVLIKKKVKFMYNVFGYLFNICF